MDLTQSQVYRELAAMAGAGLVEAGERGPRAPARGAAGRDGLHPGGPPTPAGGGSHPGGPPRTGDSSP
ncbi:MAG TPA: hypothetical protein VE776_02175 [Actinomycetota bacterium]|nr:hypothetical protein [Actinomycetota bacterium]